MDPDNFDWQREVAYGHHNLAVLDESLGRYAEAEKAMREELALYRQWTKAHPEDTNLRFEAANVASWLGSLMRHQGRLQEAAEFFSEEVDAFSRNVADEPRNARWRADWIEALTFLAEVQAMQGKGASAKATIDSACELSGALVMQDRDNNDWRTSLGTCRWWQARIESNVRPERAMEYARAAASELSAAYRAESENERVGRWLARANLLQAELSLRRGDTAAARASASIAHDFLATTWHTKKNEDLRLWLAWSRIIEADIALELGDEIAARRAWDEARELLMKGNSTIPFLRLDPLVRTLTALGRNADAKLHRQRLDAAGYVPLQPWPESVPAAAH
jgi:tetratricopeptide (TPR) repeat protein